MNPMNFPEYQQKAALTSGAGLWQPLDRDGTRLAIATLGLTGEAAEVLATVKGPWSTANAGDVANLTKELGDVCWYAAEIATCLKLGNTLNTQVEFTGQACQMWPFSVTSCAGDICVAAGRVADHVKKYLGHGHELNRPAVAEDLNRILAYVGQLGLVFGIKTEAIVAGNLAKLAKRYEGGFSVEASRERVDMDKELAKLVVKLALDAEAQAKNTKRDKAG